LHCLQFAAFLGLLLWNEGVVDDVGQNAPGAEAVQAVAQNKNPAGCFDMPPGCVGQI
jgi:hypothetical protein